MYEEGATIVLRVGRKDQNQPELTSELEWEKKRGFKSAERAAEELR